MLQKIINGKILSPDYLSRNHCILVEDDVILEVCLSNKIPNNISTLDAGDNWIVPGFIDVHIHGSFGSDTMDTEISALSSMSIFLATKGVTSFLPTTVAASHRDVTAAIKRIQAFSQPPNGAKVLGIHLEGPYLGFDHKGAQPEQHLRAAYPLEYLPWLDSGLVKLFTVAPEIEGVLELIASGVERGVKFAVGHSSANYGVMMQAIEKGLTQATHTFNGMPQLHHRNPGVVGAVLTDPRVYAQVIADGVHLHPAIIELVFNTKGVHRTILVTDAIRAAGAEDGILKLGDQIINVKDGIARTDSNALAGSTLTMNQALRNAINFTNRPLEEIIRSATTVPAMSLGLENKIGAIKPGMKADLVFLDQHHQPRLCMVSGRTAFVEREFLQENNL